MPNTIYALIDPRTDKVRYIGKTQYDVGFRLQQHLARASNAKFKSHKNNWLRQLLALNLTPRVEILDVLDDHMDWQSTERQYIEDGHLQGWPLTNSTNGGDGWSGHHTEETKRKMSVTHQGKPLSAEHRGKIAEGNKGREYSPETLRIMSVVKIGEKNGRSRLTDDKVRAIRKAYTGHGGITQQELADQYGMSLVTIWRVLAHRAWAHVTD